MRSVPRRPEKRRIDHKTSHLPHIQWLPLIKGAVGFADWGIDKQKFINNPSVIRKSEWQPLYTRGPLLWFGDKCRGLFVMCNITTAFAHKNICPQYCRHTFFGSSGRRPLPQTFHTAHCLYGIPTNFRAVQATKEKSNSQNTLITAKMANYL